jgi:hypothetical protein
MPEGRYEAYAKGEDFIRKYIFPGGHLPSISQLVENISKASEGTLVVERIENIGGHYAKTLRLWREAFMKNFDSRIRPALMMEHKDMGETEIEVFRRKWEVSLGIYPVLLNCPRSFFRMLPSLKASGQVFFFQFETDIVLVLFRILRSWVLYQNFGRCDYYRWP